MKPKPKVIMYTDGCALGNSKKGSKGGAGAVLCYGDVQKDFNCYLSKTTNNRAELQAIILGLQQLNRPCDVHVFSDSQIIVNCANGVYERKSNLDLWKVYDKASERHDVTLTWIRKDSHELNHRAHVLANQAARQIA